jgi:hypothetical protein
LAIMCRVLAGRIDEEASEWLEVLVALTEGLSAADVERITTEILRRYVLGNKRITEVMSDVIPNLISPTMDKKSRGVLIGSIRSIAGKRIPLRVLSEWFGVGESTIHHHATRRRQ